MARTGYERTPIEERLYSKCKHNEVTDCWEYQGAVNNIGYGMIRDTDHNGMRTTHRVSYEVHKGEIPNNMCVLHTCDNRRCCNPEHLWLGTHKENIHDMIDKDRHNHYGSKNSIKCDHCDMVTIPSLIKRWHNDNCKYKKTQ